MSCNWQSLKKRDFYWKMGFSVAYKSVPDDSSSVLTQIVNTLNIWLTLVEACHQWIMHLTRSKDLGINPNCWSCVYVLANFSFHSNCVYPEVMGALLMTIVS